MKKSLFFSILFVLIFSCKKTEEEINNINNLDNQAVNDNNNSQNTFDGVNDEIQSAFISAKAGGNLRTTVSNCSSITFQNNDATLPDTMFIDFDGTTCADLKTRSGLYKLYTQEDTEKQDL